MNARALKFVPYFRLEDHLRDGWMISAPNAAMHHHHYGLELKWICECPIPGASFDKHRVPISPNMSEEHDRADDRR